MKPEPARFTKDNPATKLHTWNTFRGRRGFVRRQVDEAHAIFGLNAPKYMLKEGYITRIEVRGQEFYELTEAGKEWLMKKFKSYLANHPEDVVYATNIPKDWTH